MEQALPKHTSATSQAGASLSSRENALPKARIGFEALASAPGESSSAATSIWLQRDSHTRNDTMAGRMFSRADHAESVDVGGRMARMHDTRDLASSLSHQNSASRSPSPCSLLRGSQLGQGQSPLDHLAQDRLPAGPAQIRTLGKAMRPPQQPSTWRTPYLMGSFPF